MLDTIIRICGCIFTIAAAAILLTWTKFYIEEKLELKREKAMSKALKEANVTIGRRLVTDSYWLKPEEARVMQHIGNAMLQFGTYDISKIREELNNESLSK